MISTIRQVINDIYAKDNRVVDIKHDPDLSEVRLGDWYGVTLDEKTLFEFDMIEWCDSLRTEKLTKSEVIAMLVNTIVSEVDKNL